MELVYEDVTIYSLEYHISNIDKNIDFRRVRNLKVFFKRNAISLTTDISMIKEWQGGDIVIFENHIGIVSDARNKRGIPLVFHHISPYQKNYEDYDCKDKYYRDEH